MSAVDILPAPPPVARVGLSVSRRIWRRAIGSTEFKIGLVAFAILALAAIVYPSLSGIDPTHMNVRARLMAPMFVGDHWSIAHPLGTDQIGRDMLVRCLVGLRYSFLIGVATVALMLVIGCLLGLIAGYVGGWTDTLIMRLTDAQLSIPMIILAIAVLGVSRPTIPAIVIVLGLSSWPVYARVMRSVVMNEREREYVRAAKIMGASDLRIMFGLITPLVLPPIVFVSVLDIARMMIFESVLGFIGLGVQPPTPTFGNIIADGRKYLLDAWWIATIPGIFLCLTLISVNLIGASLERARLRIFGGLA
jgi:peptide/nickel transport system permease protein